MQDIEKLKKALINADAAGDTKAAQALAMAIKNHPDYAKKTITPQVSEQPTPDFETKEQALQALQDTREPVQAQQMLNPYNLASPQVMNEQDLRQIVPDYKEALESPMRQTPQVSQALQNYFAVDRVDPNSTAYKLLKTGTDAMATAATSAQGGINLLAQTAENMGLGKQKDISEFLDIAGLFLSGNPTVLARANASPEIVEYSKQSQRIEPTLSQSRPVDVPEQTPTLATSAANVVNEAIDKVVPPQKQIKNVLGDALEMDNISPNSIRTRAARFEAVNGRRPTLLEIGGEVIVGLGEKAGTVIGKSRNIMENYRNNVLDSQTQTVKEIADKTLGGDAGNFFGEIDALEKTMRRVSQPLYAEAYEQIVPINGRTRGLIETPHGQRAARNAVDLLRQEGKNPEQLGFKIKGGKVSISPDMPVEALDAIKRGWDDIIEGYRDDTTKVLNLDSMGRASNNALREFITQIDEVSPAYKEARGAWAGNATLKNALVDGREAAIKPSVDAQTIKQRMKNMTDSEKQLFRSGFMRGLIDIMEKSVTDTNRVRKIIRSEGLVNKLTAIFDDKKAALRFVRQLRSAEKIAGRVQKISPNVGSQTARKITDVEALGDMQISGRNILSDAVKAGWSNFRQNRNIKNEQVVNREIANLLTQPLTDDVLEQLFDILRGAKQ